MQVWPADAACHAPACPTARFQRLGGIPYRWSDGLPRFLPGSRYAVGRDWRLVVIGMAKNSQPAVNLPKEKGGCKPVSGPAIFHPEGQSLTRLISGSPASGNEELAPSRRAGRARGRGVQERRGLATSGRCGLVPVTVAAVETSARYGALGDRGRGKPANAGFPYWRGRVRNALLSGRRPASTDLRATGR